MRLIITLTFDNWIPNGKMVWALALSLCARNGPAFSIDATANTLTWVHIILHACASFLMVWISFATSIASTQVTTNSVNTLGIRSTWIVKTLIYLFLALYYWIAKESGRTRTLCFLIVHCTASINTTCVI